MKERDPSVNTEIAEGGKESVRARKYDPTRLLFDTACLLDNENHKVSHNGGSDGGRAVITGRMSSGCVVKRFRLSLLRVCR